MTREGAARGRVQRGSREGSGIPQFERQIWRNDLNSAVARDGRNPPRLAPPWTGFDRLAGPRPPADFGEVTEAGLRQPPRWHLEAIS